MASILHEQSIYKRQLKLMGEVQWINKSCRAMQKTHNQA
jgi:hypothetical protein